jgi:peptidoglycan/LPS O-acetylase OafA/YrhL
MTIAAPNSTPSRPRPFRVPGLDGIRAVAVTTVIVFHLFPGTLVGGYLGVDIFFVVSGFLITTLLLRERAATGRISLRAFWARRARRLLPALGVLLLACCTTALLVGGDVLVGLGTQALGATTFSSNWLFIGAGNSYFDATVPELFRNLWSLALEEQFYLVWPLLIVLLLVRIPRTARLAIIGVLAVASAVWMGVLFSPVDPTRVYYGTDTHAFGLALGAFLAVLAVGRGIQNQIGGMPSRWVRTITATGGGLAIAALGALAFVMVGDTEIPYRGGLAAVAILTAVGIAALLVPGSPLARVLDFAPIRWVGVRSYGLYLWHWPVVVLLASALPTWSREGTEGWTLGGIALAITVLAAAVSYRYIEEPIRRHGFRHTAAVIMAAAPRSRRAYGAAFGMLVAVGLTGASVAALISDPGQGEAQQFIEAGQAAIDEATPGPAAGPNPTAGPADDDEEEAATGDQILALGDSVMLAAAPTLQAEFPGIAIDAQVSRSMYVAPSLVQAYASAGALRPVVVLALGTNGPIERSTLDDVRSILGPDRELIVVNAQAPRGWISGVNAELSSFALVYRNVELANWHDAIQPYLAEMARDQIHFGPIGARVFAATVSQAIDRLAELPPLRDDSTALAVPQPE